MADRYFLDVDGNVANTANWTGSTLPSGTENIYFDKVTKPLTTNLGALAAVNPARVRFGPLCVAPIGSQSNPLRFGNITTNCEIDCPNATSLNVQSSAFTQLVIKNGPQIANGIYIKGDTITAMYVSKAPWLYLGASVTLTLAELFASGRNPSNIYMVIDSAASVTTVTNRCGNVDCQAAITTLNHDDGLFQMLGETYGAITTLTMNGVGQFIKKGNLACTYGTVKVIKGKFYNNSSGGLLTVTNSELNEGGSILVNKTYTTFTNPLSMKGGFQKGVDNVTEIFATMDPA